MQTIAAAEAVFVDLELVGGFCDRIGAHSLHSLATHGKIQAKVTEVS